MAGTAKQLKSNNASGHARLVEAERLAEKAVLSARQARDLTKMIAAIPRLWESRKERIQAALAAQRLTIVDEPFGEDFKPKAGCYLIQPPLVASDARRLRLAAFNADIPVLVLCREPLTQTRLSPVVAISPGITLRTKVRPPQNHDKPDQEWFIDAMEQLGDWGIDTIDAALPMNRRVETLLDCLDALPEHENLHVALQEACEQCDSLRESPPAKPTQPRLQR